MANIRDISLKCGLSVSTVSKALNGYSDVNEQTRELVLRTAKSLGYVPNANARALKTNRTFNIGILFIDDQNNGLTHLYFSHVLNSFKDKAEKDGYNITFINRRWGKETITLLQNCKFRGIEGVCIACVDQEDPEVQELAQSNIPVVSIDYIFPNCACVLSNNKEDMKKLVYHAYSMGHTKIAYIHGTDSHVTQQRIAGYVEAMNELNLEVKMEYMIESLYTNAYTTRKAMEKLLRLKDRPTCILLPDDVCSFGAIDAIQSYGLTIPDDISIAGYDGVIFSRIMSPKLTTIHQNTTKIGEEAARLLIYNIEHKKHSIFKPTVIEGELWTNETVGPIVNV
ncbi:MAG: LacI family transcriptional regulator [Xylanivirga thermophila]|jgi:LacI family transcriptional regulator|uniref:LacI family DNA-binding transcriptional regulator n=1 Tax=Xylanivirga thermophila TaxID=2496273 RepID=UPI00101CC30B|nr:LacI family DNA-binding transcriptional regulator [Xylanivirga thermophila]